MYRMDKQQGPASIGNYIQYLMIKHNEWEYFKKGRKKFCLTKQSHFLRYQIKGTENVNSIVFIFTVKFYKHV